MLKYKDITYDMNDCDEEIIGKSNHYRVWKAANSYITINVDTDPVDSPRDWSNFGHMICFHRRYSLGDEHEFHKVVNPHGNISLHGVKNYDDTPDGFLEFLKRDDVISLPLYLYDHSGITMHYANTYPYNDRWDAGTVGYIYVTKDDIRENWGIKRVTGKWRTKAVEIMKREVEIYDQYLCGDVYGFNQVCDRCGETIDSCWGFYGDDWENNGMFEHIDFDTKCKSCSEIDDRIGVYVGSSIQN